MKVKVIAGTCGILFSWHDEEKEDWKSWQVEKKQACAQEISSLYFSTDVYTARTKEKIIARHK